MGEVVMVLAVVQVGSEKKAPVPEVVKREPVAPSAIGEGLLKLSCDCTVMMGEQAPAAMAGGGVVKLRRAALLGLNVAGWVASVTPPPTRARRVTEPAVGSMKLKLCAL